VTLTADRGPGLTRLLAALFFALSTVFVWRSFYGMRIRGGGETASVPGSVGAVARGK
jgi:hypothetical protein